MSLFPYMGTPQQAQGGLLGTMAQPLTGTAQSYSYPLTSGLLDHIGQAGSVGQWAQNVAGPSAAVSPGATPSNPAVAAQQAKMSQTPPDYTALALQLAGNPHAGPYSTAGNLVQPGSVGGGGNSGAGSTTGGSTGSQILGGLIGALSKDPQLVSQVGKLLGLGSGALDAYGSGAAANGAVASQLGNVANDGTAANVQASNDAALNATDGGASGAGAGLLSTGQLDSGMAANSAVNGELGSVGSQTAGTSAAIQASNDAALAAANGGAAGAGAGLLGDLGAYGSGAAADAAVASQLGNVANDGTAAAVQASNDAALAASDGGAAGAGAGAGSGALGAAGKALGAAGAAYSLYNTIKNYQSGNTGSDALNGAETGAAVGSMIVPGIGTVIGGLIGGAVGAIGSAFGAGEEDPENANWNTLAASYNQNPSLMSSLNPAQLYQGLAGVMDAKDNSPGHSEPIEQVFGRQGEQNLMDQMTNYVNQQYQAGNIKPGESVSDQWAKTIYPWLQSKGATIDPNQRTVKGAPEGSALISDLQGLLGDWEGGGINGQSPLGISGQTIGGLANYAGLSPQQLQVIADQQALRAGTSATRPAAACFSGDTRVLTRDGFKRFDELPPEFDIVNRAGPRRAQLIVHEGSTEPMREMGPHLVTDRHLIQAGNIWLPASDLFHKQAPAAARTVYNMHVLSDDPDEHHYILENGLVAHNMKMRSA